MPFALTVTRGKLSPTGVKKIKNNYRMSSCIQATDNCYSDFFKSRFQIKSGSGVRGVTGAHQ